MRHLRLFLILAIILPAIPVLVYGQQEIQESPTESEKAPPSTETNPGDPNPQADQLGVEGKAIGLYCSVKEVCVIAASAEDCNTIGGVEINASECKASAPKAKQQEEKPAAPE